MNWRRFGYKRKADEKSIHATQETLAEMDCQLEKLNNDKHLYYHAPPLRLLSVFDDLKYDRSDLDLLSLRMRQHIVTALKEFGCVQQSGHMIFQPTTGVRFIMPKFVALGASPFATTRYHQRHENDYWIFTPTQAACFMIDNLPFEDALIQTEALLQRQPINIYRILDFFERKATHQSFRKVITHLDRLQKKAINSEPLSEVRSL